MTPAGTLAARRLVTSKALIGSALVLQPRTVLSLAAGRRAVVPAWLARILGARILLQSVVEFRQPTRSVLYRGAIIDLAHATSMIPFTITGRYRRIALASATLAAGTAALSIRAAARIPHEAVEART